MTMLFIFDTFIYLIIIEISKALNSIGVGYLELTSPTAFE